MQVRLVFFQAAQQALSFGDSFFQCDHAIDGQGIDAASRVSTMPQQWQSASCKLDAGWVGVFSKRFWETVNWRAVPPQAIPGDRLGQRRVALQLIGHFILQVVGQPFFKLVPRTLWIYADAVPGAIRFPGS